MDDKLHKSLVPSVGDSNRDALAAITSELRDRWPRLQKHIDNTQDRSERYSEERRAENGAMYEDDYDYDGDEWYSDEEELAAERELAADAPWKMIQKNTFTRWCNEHLKPAQKVVSDIEFDLADGLNLIALIEVLSGKKFRHVNKRPNFRSQKLENVTNTLRFLEDEEGIKIVNIDSTDIIDSRIKLILGLIWTLILHYSISMPLWDDDDYGMGAREGPTPKQRLLIWVQNRIPELPIRNFTTDWNDGKAIGALVDAVGPGLCPDWTDWDPQQAQRNATEAMDLAEKWLDVPQLIKPEEMVNPKVDEQSMMTYLSQFPNAKLNPDAPIRPKTNSARVRAYGPGLEPHGNCIDRPANFKIETFAGGKGEPLVLVKNPRGQPERYSIVHDCVIGLERHGVHAGILTHFTVQTAHVGPGRLDVHIVNPSGRAELCEMTFNNDRNLTYSCQYIPSMEGDYTVMIQFAGQEIPKSPFRVNVEGAPGDASKVTAAGPGLEPNGLQAGKKTYFEVYTEGAGTGNVEIIIIDPHGQRDSTKPRIARSTETTYYVEYLPKDVGRYTVHIFFASKEIPASPYPVNVGAPVEPKKCYATGRGIQPRGVRVGDLADIQVHTEGAGEGEVTGTLVGPEEENKPGSGREEPLSFKPVAADTYETAYVPKQPGIYTINLQYGAGHIQKSPFKVNVGPHKDSNIRAYGPGLEGGIANKPADFVVETNGETGALGFAIEGPSQAKIDCIDKGDGSADVSYLPTVAGEYAVHVLCNNEDIPKSPFMAQIAPPTRDFNPAQVVAWGPGLEKTGVIQNKWAQFTVDTRAAGLAPLKVYCEDVEGRRVDIQVKDNRDGTFSCQYLPKKPIKHTIIISYGGVNTPKSPYRVYVEEPSRPENVKVYGPGIEGPVKTFEPTHFFVDCSEAGPGDVAISLCDERGLDVPVNAADNGEGLFRIEYEAKSVGWYTANILFADQEIPSSPYKVNVQPNIDVSKIRVSGLQPKIPVNVPAEFQVENQGAETAPVSVNIRSPNGRTVLPMVEESPTGHNVTFIPREEGPHQVYVSYGSMEIPASPFNTTAYKPVEEKPVEAPRVAPKTNATNQSQAAPISNVNKVKAYGDGLYRGITTKPAEFTIDTREAGPGALGLTIEGPIEARMEARDLGDGTCQVTYYPTEAGDYNISIYYCNEPIPGVPYVAHIEPGVVIDVSGVTAYGPGLKPNGVFLDSTTDFTVDARSITPSCAGKVRAIITNPSGTKNDTMVTPNGDGTYHVSYAPSEAGPCKIDVTYENLSIPQSPFGVTISEGCDPSRVKAYGPGLERGYTNQPQTFTIETKGAGQGSLSLAVEGPSKAEVTCKDNHDGTCTVDYVPTKAGDYDITVKFADKDIPGSSFKVPIEDKVDPTRCRMYGPGLNTEGVRATLPATFTVDCTEAGNAPLQVTYDDGRGHKRPAETLQVQPGVYQCTYYPAEEGICNIDVMYANQHIPGSPVKQKILPVFDASKVLVSGPGVENGIPASLPTAFLVDTTDAGDADLDIAVQAPDGSFLRPTITDNRDATVTVAYTPDECGVYQPKVKYGGNSVPGSPFQVHTRPSGNANNCHLKDPKRRVVVDEECVINVDKSLAGPGNVTARINSPSGQPTDIEIEDNNDGTVSIYYTPRHPGNYDVNIKFGGVEIPGGQFIVEAVPQGQHIIQGRLTQNQPQIQSTVSSNQYSKRQPLVTADTEVSSRSFKQPRDQVLHVTSDHYSSLPQNQQRALVGQSEAVPIHQQPPVHTTITAHTNRQQQNQQYNPYEEVDSQRRTIVTETHRTYKITSSSQQDADYSSTDRVDSYKTQKTSAPANMFHPVDFVIPTGPVFNYTSARVITPTGGTYMPDIVDNGDGSVTIKYQPQETGLHNLHVAYNNKPIEGSPYQFYVDAVDSGVVAAYGPGLSYGVAGEPCSFTIDTKNAGAGGLSLAVEGPSKAEISCVDNHDGTCTVTFIPRVAGEYRASVKVNGHDIPGSPYLVKVQPRPGALSLAVEGPSKVQIVCDDNQHGLCRVKYSCPAEGNYEVLIKFDGQHVVGSPFRVHIYGESHERSQFSMGTASEFSLSVKEYDISTLSADITTPSGRAEPCSLKKLPNGHLGISFTPHETGTHLVNVYKDRHHIPGSPFKIEVTRNEVGDASKVRVYGEGLYRGYTNQISHFIVDTRDAGYGGLSLSIEGPSKADIDCKDRPDGTCGVSYKPTQPGTYVIAIKFADEHVPGSPFNCKIGGVATNKEESISTRTVKTVETTHVGSVCELALKVPGSDPMEMVASVTSPTGVTELCDIVDRSEDHYIIKFVPKEMGVHTICVKHKGLHIPGSPFQFTIGPIVEGGAHKVHANGPGLERAEVGHPNEFCIYTREAGAGGVTIAVEGPSKATIHFDEKTEGTSVASFLAAEPGEYTVSVKFNDEHIPDSPFRVPVNPSSGDARKVSVQSLKQKGLEIGKPVAFTTVFNGAKGVLGAKVVAPTGAEDEALIQPLDDTSSHYAVRFVPRENGVHYIHVMLSGTHIRGSPFRVIVGDADPDPGLVCASGEGLVSGKTGQPNGFTVNTASTKAASTLAVTVDGPSKVQIAAQEVGDGYNFKYTPTAPGDYFIAVKFGGNYHIAGSPFKAKITGSGKSSSRKEHAHCVVETVRKSEDNGKCLPKFNSDATKVTSKGLGLNKAFMGRVAQFSVDTSQAGQNLLYCAMVGPAGSPPVDEMSVKHHNRNVFNCSYTVKHKGKYLLIVKYGDENIPGSPFNVNVI